MSSQLFLFVSGEDEREALICHNRRTRIIPLIITSDIAVQQVLNCEIVIIRVDVGGVDKRQWLVKEELIVEEELIVWNKRKLLSLLTIIGGKCK